MPSISINQISYETDLVIFDKDGTLLDFQASWLGIIAALIEAIGRRTPMSAALSSRIQRYLGIDLAGEEIHGFGPLAMGTDVETEIKVWVVPTDEETMIARHVARLVG